MSTLVSVERPYRNKRIAHCHHCYSDLSSKQPVVRCATEPSIRKKFSDFFSKEPKKANIWDLGTYRISNKTHILV